MTREEKLKIVRELIEQSPGVSVPDLDTLGDSHLDGLYRELLRNQRDREV
jgi:hypothetical protein